MIKESPKQAVEFQSKRVLDFQNQPQVVQNPSLLSKLNEVEFPVQIGPTPQVNQSSSQKMKNIVPCTPITEMMKLRNWQQQKIKNTKISFDESVLPARKLILSDKLLTILNIQDKQKEHDLCIQISTLSTNLIDKILLGLAKK